MCLDTHVVWLNPYSLRMTIPNSVKRHAGILTLACTEQLNEQLGIV